MNSSGTLVSPSFWCRNVSYFVLVVKTPHFLWKIKLNSLESIPRISWWPRPKSNSRELPFEWRACVDNFIVLSDSYVSPMWKLNYTLHLAEQYLRTIVHSKDEMFFYREWLAVESLEINLIKPFFFTISIKITALTIDYINRANL